MIPPADQLVKGYRIRSPEFLPLLARAQQMENVGQLDAIGEPAA